MKKTDLRNNLEKKINEYEQILIKNYGQEAEKALEKINGLPLTHTKP